MEGADFADDEPHEGVVFLDVDGHDGAPVDGGDALAFGADDFDGAAGVFLGDVGFGEVGVDEAAHAFGGEAGFKEFLGDAAEGGFEAATWGIHAGEVVAGVAVGGGVALGGDPEAVLIAPTHVVVEDVVLAVGALDAGGADDAVEVPGAVFAFGFFVPGDEAEGDVAAVGEAAGQYGELIGPGDDEVFGGGMVAAAVGAWDEAAV